jgi:predicted ATPase
MSQQQPSDGLVRAHSMRFSRLHQVLLEHIRKRLAGDTVTDEELLRQHPDLEPDLGEQLRLLAELPSHSSLESAGDISNPAANWNNPPIEGNDKWVAGKKLGHYCVLSLLGVGGMGEVYLAQDTRLGRKLAIKRLPSELTKNADRVKRFHREALAASALNHPNIVTIYDIDVSESEQFIAMEFVEGKTLRDVMCERISLDVLVRLSEQIAQALRVAHESGITHRDIKPENVMVRDDGYVKVLDFGLARLQSPEPNAKSCIRSHTVSGLLIGTINYMSPEQAMGKEVGPSSDVFSLGVVVYELSAGRHPFLAESFLGTLNGIVSLGPSPPSQSNPKLTPEFDLLVLRMLEKDPRHRPTAEEICRCLDEIRSTVRGIQQVVAVETDAVALRAHTVGRETELEHLRAGYSSARAGSGKLLCVVGEPGIGKTTVVNDFLAELRGRGQSCWIARGQCSERLAGTEAYLPWLEVIDNLLRHDGGMDSESPFRGTPDGLVSRMMKQLAPTWFAQVVSLNDDSSAERLLSQRASSQERMKRELAALAQGLCRSQPLIVVIEDLHWADVSTVDLLGFLADRFHDLRMLVIATYRPTDLLLSQHPFLQLKPNLQSRGLCQEITLGFLNRQDIERYLNLEFSENDFPEMLSKLIYMKTEGNPLFMVDLIRYLRDQEVIVQRAERWIVAESIPAMERGLPQSVRGMIDRKISQVSQEDRRLLTAASVQGFQFDSAVIVKLLELSAEDVEERLDALDRVHGFVRLVEECEFPDGSLTLRYRFVHVLYQNALYSQLPPSRRIHLSRHAANILLQYYGESSGNVASELAHLFEAARESGLSAEHFLRAAQNAASIFAYQEAIRLACRGITLLGKLPDSRERSRLEIDLLLTLGPAQIAIHGYGVPEVAEVYSRSRDLCERLADTSRLVTVLYNIWVVDELRADMPAAHKTAEQCLNLARTTGESSHLVLGHTAMGETGYFSGDFATGREHHRRAIDHYRIDQHGTLGQLHGGYDPVVACYGIGAHGLWCLGYPDQAFEHSRKAVAMAQRLSDPHTLAFALCHASLLHYFRREIGAVWDRAEATFAVSVEHGLAFWVSFANILRGRVLAERGQCEEGITLIREGINGYRATGSKIELSLFAVLLAEAHEQAGRFTEAQRILTESLAEIRSNGVCFLEAELLRMVGELLLREMETEMQLQSNSNRKMTLADMPLTTLSEAEFCFQQALDVSRRQQAKSWELRATLSLSRLWRDQNKKDEAREVLAGVCNWFSEGQETTDLRDARQMITELTSVS